MIILTVFQWANESTSKRIHSKTTHKKEEEKSVQQIHWILMTQRMTTLIKFLKSNTLDLLNLNSKRSNWHICTEWWRPKRENQFYFDKVNRFLLFLLCFFSFFFSSFFVYYGFRSKFVAIVLLFWLSYYYLVVLLFWFIHRKYVFCPYSSSFITIYIRIIHIYIFSPPMNWIRECFCKTVWWL